MAKKTIRFFVEKEVEPIIDKRVGNTITTAYIDHDTNSLGITMIKMSEINGVEKAGAQLAASFTESDVRLFLEHLTRPTTRTKG
jgi:hypothetical protein